MNVSGLDVLMVEEFIAVFYSAVLLGFAVHAMFPALFNPKKLNVSAWYLVGCYFGVMSVAFSRGLGILLGNISLRFYGALLSGLVTVVFYSLWGATQLGWSDRRKRVVFSLTIVGGLSFALGRFYVWLALLGLGILGLIVIFTVISLLRYALQNLPYLIAHQRVKIITLGIIVLILFELSGVYFMKFELWLFAALLFFFRVIGLSIITLGVVFPESLQQFLKKRVNVTHSTRAIVA